MGSIEYLNPAGLLQNKAFSQIVITRGGGKTIYVGGQNSINEKREIIGINDVKLQTEKIMQNLEVALKSCGATFSNLVKLSIHIVQGHHALAAFEVSQKFLRNNKYPPAITVVYVSGLANPQYLLEIDAIAFIPD